MKYACAVTPLTILACPPAALRSAQGGGGGCTPVSRGSVSWHPIIRPRILSGRFCPPPPHPLVPASGARGGGGFPQPGPSVTPCACQVVIHTAPGRGAPTRGCPSCPYRQQFQRVRKQGTPSRCCMLYVQAVGPDEGAGKACRASSPWPRPCNTWLARRTNERQLSYIACPESAETSPHVVLTFFFGGGGGLQVTRPSVLGCWSCCTISKHACSVAGASLEQSCLCPACGPECGAQGADAWRVTFHNAGRRREGGQTIVAAQKQRLAP